MRDDAFVARSFLNCWSLCQTVKGSCILISSHFQILYLILHVSFEVKVGNRISVLIDHNVMHLACMLIHAFLQLFVIHCICCIIVLMNRSRITYVKHPYKQTTNRKVGEEF